MAVVTVSLTTFADFAAATGSAKVGKLQNAKRQYSTEYTAAFDYWLTLRNAIVALHDDGLAVATLPNVLIGLHEKKVSNYTQCVDAYKKWLARKNPRLLPKKRHVEWNSSGLAVRVNPELFLELDSERLALKLYFSSPPITRVRRDVYLHLLGNTAGPEYRPAVLDVRRGKLHAAKLPALGMEELLNGEARLFVEMWQAL